MAARLLERALGAGCRPLSLCISCRCLTCFQSAWHVPVCVCVCVCSFPSLGVCFFLLLFLWVDPALTLFPFLLFLL